MPHSKSNRENNGGKLRVGSIRYALGYRVWWDPARGSPPAKLYRNLSAVHQTPVDQNQSPKMRILLFGLTALLVLVPRMAFSQESASTHNSRYPAQWWTPIIDPAKPDWEILPQEAGPGEVILSKRNELGLLSNFAATPFTFRGKRYASLEGFWQMMLYPEGPDDPRTN